MKFEELKESVSIPEGVTVIVDKNVVTVQGPKGTIAKPLVSKRVIITLENNEIIFLAKNATKNQKKLLYTFRSIVNNMIKGVTEGYVYKLKICSGHFPMNVSLKGNKIEIKNFIGEAVPRVAVIKEGAEVKIEGDIIQVSGIDKELVGQAAGLIENLTKRPGFDTRIFQDGIYIIEKDGKKLG